MKSLRSSDLKALRSSDLTHKPAHLVLDLADQPQIPLQPNPIKLWGKGGDKGGGKGGDRTAASVVWWQTKQRMRWNLRGIMLLDVEIGAFAVEGLRV